ncbi:hypothetical protein AB0C45_03725 [Streptomyces cyaneofuscatus]|uniref:hypothetical protein n=1 Tax=Streptomyces cyaneofuscatus TaxID=66883 RepID=UPI0033E6CA13
MTHPKTRRNEALAYWVGVSRATLGQLAEELARTARSHERFDIEPDRSRISRWVNKGEQPRRPVPEFLAETLTRLCGLAGPLTLADIGLAGATASRPSHNWRSQTVVSAIIDTTRSDAVTDDAAPIVNTLLHGPQLIDAVQPWLHLPDDGALPDATRPGRLGMSDVAAIQATTDIFRSLDNAHGGGLSWRAVVGQLHAVTDKARQGRVSDEVGRQLFVSVADLASVAGWMAHDVGRHERAQDYLLLGLKAAKQAGPDGAAIAGHLLNCLARQANHLGHPGDALDLVQLAQYGTRKLPPGRLRAMLCTLEARCHAVLGQLPDCGRALGAAEDALAAERDVSETPSWAAWFDSAEYQVTVGVCEHLAAEHDPNRGRRAARAIKMIQTGTAERPDERTRSRAFDQIALARATLRAGHLDAADEVTATALDLLGQVNSTRVIDRLRELDSELAAAPAAKETSQARERIRAALPAAA